MNSNVKSATIAGLLGIFLGSVGAHDWYLGNKKKGAIHVCLAASGIIVSIIASVILPATLSFRALLTMAALISVLSIASLLIMIGNGIWGMVEGIIIISQGDAGLARKGYVVAQPNMNYGGNNGSYNNYGNQPMNNFGGQQNMNNMGNGNIGNQNFGNNGGNMNNGNMNGGMNGNGQMNQNSGNQNGQ